MGKEIKRFMDGYKKQINDAEKSEAEKRYIKMMEELRELKKEESRIKKEILATNKELAELIKAKK